MNNHPSSARTATLHRMAMDKHVCPWGLKSLILLKSRGFGGNGHLDAGADILTWENP